MIDYNEGEHVMANDPNQEQGPSAGNPPQNAPQFPHETYGSSENPYGEPPIPYSQPPQNPYGESVPQYPNAASPQAPQNPYRPPAQNPYATPPNADANYASYSNYQGGSGYAPPQSAPLPLGEAIRNLPSQYLKVLTRPGPMTFAEEMGKASWDIVWVQLIGIAIISAILSYLAMLISPFNTSFSNRSINIEAYRSIIAGASFGSIILVPLFFFIGVGIYYGLAKAFGGQGRFITQSYTTLLISVPIGIFSGVINLIPIAGSFIALAVSIYSIVLNIFSIMAVHRLSGGKATAVVLIPIGVAVLLACGLIVLLITIVAALSPP
jgi:Yip1 domain